MNNNLDNNFELDINTLNTIKENNNKLQEINNEISKKILDLKKQIKDRESLLRLLQKHHQSDIESELLYYNS